jgi:hypothetical protein
MAHLTNWLFGLAALLALVVFLTTAFELLRRLAARYALRLCQRRRAPEGGFICDLKHKLYRFAKKPLLLQTVVMIGSFALLVFIVVEHSPKL